MYARRLLGNIQSIAQICQIRLGFTTATNWLAKLRLPIIRSIIALVLLKMVATAKISLSLAASGEVIKHCSIVLST
jgi:hypothetical protein